MNVLPFGGSEHYFIDIGGNDTTGNAKLTGPLDRVSEKKEFNNITFRDLKIGLVYFDLNSPHLNEASDITVQVRFKDNFPKDQKFILGANNKKEWSYHWKELYVPIYENLNQFQLILKNKSLKIYSINNLSAQFFTVNDFLKNPPENSIIGVNSKDIYISQIPKIDYVSKKNITTKFSLRGGHTFYVFVTNNSLYINVTKQDLNAYDGKDELNISVYSLNGTLKGNTTITDDGMENKTNKLGKTQSKSLVINNLKKGTYKIELKGGSDLLIKEVHVNQGKLVVSKKIFLAGNIYTKKKPEQMSVYFYNSKKGKISFMTYHNISLQNITLIGEKYNKTIKLDKRAKWFSLTLNPGTYKLISEKGDIIIQSPINYFSFTSDSFFTPKRCEVINLKPDMAWMKENLDYIILKDYDVKTDKDGWKIATTRYNVDELYIKDNKLNFVFNVPHLGKKEYKNYTIPIDWIKVDIKIPPIRDR